MEAEETEGRNAGVWVPPADGGECWRLLFIMGLLSTAGSLRGVRHSTGGHTAPLGPDSVSASRSGFLCREVPRDISPVTVIIVTEISVSKVKVS